MYDSSSISLRCSRSYIFSYRKAFSVRFGRSYTNSFNYLTGEEPTSIVQKMTEMQRTQHNELLQPNIVSPTTSK